MLEYPKWIEGRAKDEFGQDRAFGVTVDNEHQESTAKAGTALYECVKSAQGDTWRWVGPWPTSKPVKEEEPDPDTVSEMLGFKKSKKKK